MAKRFLLIGCFILLAARVSFPQKTDFALPDSLQSVLDNSGTGLKRCEALQTIIDMMHEQQQFKDSSPYIDELEKLSNSLNDNFFMAYSIYYQGCVSFGKNEFGNAIEHLAAAREKAKELPDNDRSNTLKVRIQIVMGACYIKLLQLPQAYQCLQEGVELNKDLGDQHLQFKLDNNLLVTYRYLGLYDEIIAISKKMLANTEYSDYNKYMTYFGIARFYFEKHIYDTTEMYLDTALMYAQSPTYSAWIWLYRGITDNHTAQYEEALGHFENGLSLVSKENNREVESNLMINKGVTYSNLGDFEKALNLLDAGIEMAEASGFLYLQKNGLAYKKEVLYQMGRYKEYADVSRLYEVLNDSIEAAKNLDKLQQMELEHQFDMAKEQMEQAQLMKDMQQQRHRLILYLVIVALAFGIVTTILLLNRNKILLKNKQIQEEAMSRELDLRNRELTAKALVQSQRQEILTDIIEKLTAIQNDKKKISDSIQPIINDFKQYRNAQTPEDFDYYFTQTHPDFYKNLSHDFPDLTPYEMHLCAYIRLNLNTKDIAEICGIEPASVRMARHRLRKSLGITDSDTDLIKFLSKY